MKKNYINPTFKVYGFEPESEFLGVSINETDTSASGSGNNNTIIGSGEEGDAAGYRSNLWAN